MTIELNHTIVPSRDKAASARFYQEMFGFEYNGSSGHFEPVRIPNQGLTLDFDNRESFERHHYAFKVSEEEFDTIFARIEERKLTYGSGPFSPRGRRDQSLERRPRRLLQGPGRTPAGTLDARLCVRGAGCPETGIAAEGQSELASNQTGPSTPTGSVRTSPRLHPPQCLSILASYIS